MRSIYFTIIAVIICVNITYSQTSEIKKLEKKLSATKGEARIKILDELSESYLDYNSNKSIEFAELALKETKKIKISELIEGSLYNTLAAAYYYQNEIKKSLNYYEKELVIIQKTSSENKTVKALYNIAVLYQKEKKYNKAEKYFELSLESAQKLKSTDLILHNYKALYELYVEWNKSSKALEYLQYYVSIKDEKFKKTQQNVTILRKKYDKEKQLRQISDSVLVISEDKRADLTEDTIRKSHQLGLLKLQQEFTEKLDKQQEEINDAKFSLNNAEIERTKLQVTMYIIISLIIGIAAIWLWLLYRDNKKANRILRDQKEEIYTQSELLEITNSKLEEKNTQIIDSINYARRIQDSLMISESEIQRHLPDAFVFYKPKDIVSGDFYWFSKIDEKLVLAAIDCTGHGVPGAFMSMIGNMLLNEIVNEKRITKPDEILKLLHKGVIQALQQNNETKADDGMDMSLCTIDPNHKRFQFAGAKNHLYVIQGDRLKVLKANINSIGGRPLRDDIVVEFTSYDFMYDDKTSIYMMSDGYMDQFGGLEDTKFNSKRFKEMLLENRSLPMTQQKEIISSTLSQWKGNKDQVDDILVLGVKL